MSETRDLSRVNSVIVIHTFRLCCFSVKAALLVLLQSRANEELFLKTIRCEKKLADTLADKKYRKHGKL